MNCGLSITIKNYFNRGGDLTLKITGAQYGDGASSSKSTKLTVTRKPDEHSSRLLMFAFLRNTQPGYQNFGFPQLTLSFVRCNDAGAFLSMSTNVFFDVVVDSSKPMGDEEVITFIAASKAPEVKVP